MTIDVSSKNSYYDQMIRQPAIAAGVGAALGSVISSCFFSAINPIAGIAFALATTATTGAYSYVKDNDESQYFPSIKDHSTMQIALFAISFFANLAIGTAITSMVAVPWTLPAIAILLGVIVTTELQMFTPICRNLPRYMEEIKVENEKHTNGSPAYRRSMDYRFNFGEPSRRPYSPINWPY